MNTRWSALTLESEMTPAEIGFLLSLVAEKGLKGRHLEIGTGAGGTLRALLEHHRGEVPCVTVDPMTYFPDQLAVVRRNLEASGFAAASEIRVTTSAGAYRRARANGEVFDLLLIDGSHTESAVTGDLRWASLVKCPGIVCVHDYGEARPGVMCAVDRFLHMHPNFRTLGRSESLIAFDKVAEDRSADPWRREAARIIAWIRDVGTSRSSATPIDAYVDWESSRVEAGFVHQTLGEHARDDGSQDFAALLALGLKPHHVVVDFGCGSLRLGRHLIPFLDPANYWGVDITDRFFRVAAERLDVSKRRPRLHVLSRPVIQEIAQLSPDVLLVAGVLQLVPHHRLPGFFGVIASMCAANTQVLATVLESEQPSRVGRFGFRQTSEQIVAAANGAGLKVTWLREGWESSTSPSARLPGADGARVPRASLLLFTRHDLREGVLAVSGAACLA